MLLVAVLCIPRMARAEDAQPRQSPTGVCPVFWNDVPTDLVANIYLVEDREGNTLLPPYRPIGEARPVDTDLDGEADTLVAYIFGDANGDGTASPGEALPLTEHPEYGWIDCVEDADEHDSLDPDHLAGIGADDEDDGGDGPDGGNGPDGGGGSSGDGGANGGGNGGGIGGRDPGEISSNPASGRGGRGGMDPAAMPMVRAGDRNNCGENHERNCLPSTLSTAMTHDLANAYDHDDKLRYARSARDNPPGLEIPFGSEGRSGRGAEDSDVPNHANIYKYKSFDRIPRAVDIGVDREILRTSMAVYQPLRRLHKDALEDEVARDDYLDAAMTLRGVTVMAMGFLDKTLGAGLAAINEQKHASSADHLLKQIAWTTTRLSNDDAQQVFRDVDEKLEACLEMALTRGKAGDRIADTTRKRVEFTCSRECGEAPGEARPYRGTEPRARTGNGTYAYCVCCAETAADLQKLSEGTRGPALLRSSPDDLWTLAERAFFGVMGEVDTKSPAYKTLELFKMLFGDVVLKKAGGETPAVAGGEGLFLRTGQGRAARPAGERIAATGEPYFHYAFQMPKADPRRVVGMYKNRCYFSPGGAVRSDLGKSGEDCGLEEETRFLVTKGICPSLMAILNNWEEILAPRKPDASDEILIARQSPGEIDIDRLWMEATVGHPLTGRDIKEILSLNGDPSSRIRPDSERELAARFIETWCDASAISAAARFYTTFKTRVLDHVILSRILTQREKMELMQLVDRYHEYFALAELDANTSLASTAALVGASISYDRYKAAHAGSMTSTGHSTNIVAANDGSLNQWGSQAGPTIASTGGGSSRSRIFATFSRDFSVRPSTAELLEGYRKEFGVEGEHAVARLELNREDLVEKALEGLTMPGR